MGLGVNPYIAFRGNCREALDFYKQALGAEEVFAQTYGDSPMSEMGNPDAIMHATLKIGGSPVMFCDDFHSPNFSTGGNISLAIGLNDVDKAKEYFANLSEGGTVTMPLDKTFWAGTSVKTNFICNLGYGDSSKIFARSPRLSFDEACKLL